MPEMPEVEAVCKKLRREAKSKVCNSESMTWTFVFERTISVFDFNLVEVGCHR